MAAETERRRHQRVLVNWPVIVVTPQRYIGGEAKNISIGGAFIRCITDPGQTEPLRVVIKAPTREDFLRVTAVMAWSNLHEQTEDLYYCETGVRFTSFIDDSRQYLAEVISEHLRSKSG